MFARIATLAALALTLVAAEPALAKPKITNYQTEGNLEVTHKLGCIAFADVQGSYTPADLYPAVAKCIADQQYEKAFELYGVAGVYARFDSLRVADQTAHQAASVLSMTAFADLTPAQGKAFQAAAKGIMEDPARKQDFCARVAKLGPPGYYPRYMIQHGMGAFLGRGNNALVEGFEPGPAFAKALEAYLHC